MAPTGSGTAPGNRTAPVNLHALLQDWGHLWGLADFAQTVQVEWSQRFRRSLGRVHLDRRVVRLSAELAVAPSAVLLEVLCHEVAHLAARDLHGGNCRSHGPEWVALIRAIGFEPRRRIPWSASPAPARRTRSRRRYIHRCPVCQRHWTARRPVQQWRCTECVAVGLSGQLEISSLPARRPT